MFHYFRQGGYVIVVVCLSLCLSVSLFACLFVCLSLCLPVCLFACLFVCLPVSNFAQKVSTNLHDIFREVGNGPRNKLLNFSGDPVPDRDTGKTCLGRGMHCPSASSCICNKEVVLKCSIITTDLSHARPMSLFAH